MRRTTSFALVCGLTLMAWTGTMGFARGAVRDVALPTEVEAALLQSKVPRDAVSFLVVDALGQTEPRLSHRADAQMNPASAMKLVTTYAALDLLGPHYTWATPVFLDGTVRDGTLHGNVYIQGQGDPKLVLEHLWLLLRRLQGLGIRSIAGDFVIDQSAYQLPEHDPASFDGDPLRPYNAAPEALLINFKSVMVTLTPDVAAVARVHNDPPLDGVQMQATVPLRSGECGDYRTALKSDFSDPKALRFAGHYPQSCGEKVWAFAYPDPKTYATRAVAGLWRNMGGQLQGTARLGSTPSSPQWKPAFEVKSAPLAEIIRDINKYSNNVMAQQVFLTLGRVPSLSLAAGGAPSASDARPPPGSFAASRAIVQRWWAGKWPTLPTPVLDNGSGLSRHERISAQALGALLQSAYQSPVMPELMASLPVNGVDGTLRRSKSASSAHLKTGSLNQVVALAGYVHGTAGHRWVLVALVNHPNAPAARPALQALVDWTALQRP